MGGCFASLLICHLPLGWIFLLIVFRFNFIFLFMVRLRGPKHTHLPVMQSYVVFRFSLFYLSSSQFLSFFVFLKLLLIVRVFFLPKMKLCILFYFWILLSSIIFLYNESHISKKAAVCYVPFAIALQAASATYCYKCAIHCKTLWMFFFLNN